MNEIKPLLASMPKKGLVLEFGVSSGSSLCAIANAIAPRLVYGFDWFKGLPEDWSLSTGDVHCCKGSFAAKVPKVPDNAILVHGLFQDTLEPFLLEHNEPIAFVHFDADLYSSTKYILDRIADRLLTGTVFVFDEFDQCQAHKEHEARAFAEFMSMETYYAEPLEYLRLAAAAFRMVHV